MLYKKLGLFGLLCLMASNVFAIGAAIPDTRVTYYNKSSTTATLLVPKLLNPTTYNLPVNHPGMPGTGPIFFASGSHTLKMLSGTNPRTIQLTNTRTACKTHALDLLQIGVVLSAGLAKDSRNKKNPGAWTKNACIGGLNNLMRKVDVIIYDDRIDLINKG